MSVWNKVTREQREAIRKEMNRVCQCGQPFALHGAAPPHTIGDDCPGFAARLLRAKAGRG